MDSELQAIQSRLIDLENKLSQLCVALKQMRLIEEKILDKLINIELKGK